MSYGLHTHNYKGVTTFNDGHEHGYVGTTSQAPDIPGHTHRMVGETTFDDGHSHGYSLQTSPPLPAGNGHTHYYQSETTFNDQHIHYLFGYNTVSE